MKTSIKNALLTGAITLHIVALSPLVAFNLDENKSVSKVQKLEGYYIYIKSEPVAQYETLGTVKSPGIVKSLALNTMLNTMIKQVKKQHPDADGIIFNSSTEDGLSRCEAIKFK